MSSRASFASLARSVTLGCVLAAAGSAQVVIDVPLPPGMPLGFRGPSFATAESLAVAGEGAIHSWSDLTGTTTHTGVIPPGAMAMGSPWVRLSDSVALYAALGADLVAGTGDDELVLVTGLPANPTLVPTGLVGEESSFQAINASAAVRVDPTTASFRVLRWSEQGAVIDVVPSPVPLLTSADYAGGRLSDARMFVLSPGADAVPGTTDDLAVLLSGLDSAAYVVTTMPLPGAPLATRVSASGVAAILDVPMALPDLRLTLLQDVGGGVTSRGLSLTTPGTAPFGCTLGDAAGDAILVHCPDAATPLTWSTLVNDLTSSATVAGTWSTSAITQSYVTPLTADEVAVVDPGGPCAACNATVFALRRFGAGAPQSVLLPLGEGRDYWFTAPNATSRVALVNRRHPGFEAALLVAGDPFVGPALSAFALPGQWTGDLDTGGARLITLGPGRLAAFASSALPFGPPTPELLRIVTVPAAEFVAPGIATLSPWPPVALHVLPRVPRADQPIQCVVTSTVPASQSALFAFSLGLAGPVTLGPPHFVSATLLQLDLQQLALGPVVPMAAGQATQSLDLAPLGLPIRGLPLYVQALVHSVANPEGVPWFLSETWMIVGA